MGQTSRRALALTGGGVAGFLFEIGALTAFDDVFGDGFRANEFDLYVGESAGAAIAAFLANGVRPEEILAANLRGERPYYFEQRDIFTPALGEGLKTFLRAAKQMIRLAQVYVPNRHEMSLVDLLGQAHDALPCGVYTLQPFARYLEDTFAAKGLSSTFDGLRKELYIPAVDLETGETVIFGDGDRRGIPISLAITASSAVPVYFCPVRIDGRDYIDGGIGPSPFLEVAIRKGADFVIVIHPMAPSRGKPIDGAVRLRDRGFLAIGEQASRINTEAKFLQALRLVRREEPDKEFFVVLPKPSDTLCAERNFLSFQNRVHLLECGYLTVVELMEKQCAEVQVRFARHGLALSLDRIEERMRRRLEQFAGARAVVRRPGPESVPGHMSVQFAKRR